MQASFDKAAQNYDDTFTNSEIGKMQRSMVYYQLEKQLKNVQNILEINCGTGEDAIWFAKQNFKVTATDISSKMIEVANNKAKFSNLNFKTVDIKSIATGFENDKFDLIFSNFGGLNCLTNSELDFFLKNIHSLLREKGKLILVIMPKNTVWEQFYFFTKAQFSKVFRRKKESSIANVDGENFPTYYYNPKDIVNLAKQDFELIEQKPIGFFIPPSYLEPFFKNKIGLLKILYGMEKQIKNWSFLSKYADHYIIKLQKR